MFVTKVDEHAEPLLNHLLRLNDQIHQSEGIEVAVWAGEFRIRGLGQLFARRKRFVELIHGMVDSFNDRIEISGRVHEYAVVPVQAKESSSCDCGYQCWGGRILQLPAERQARGAGGALPSYSRGRRYEPRLQHR